MDTSVKWRAKGTTDKVETLYNSIRAGKRFELQLFDYTSHTNFAATNPGMFDYIPEEEAFLKQTPMYGANAILLFGTKRIRHEVLRWWIACALEQKCMAPDGAKLSCHWGADRDNYYAECHRFDQSALNVLTSKAAKRAFEGNYTHSLYTGQDVGIEIERY